MPVTIAGKDDSASDAGSSATHASLPSHASHSTATTYFSQATTINFFSLEDFKGCQIPLREIVENSALKEGDEPNYLDDDMRATTNCGRTCNSDLDPEDFVLVAEDLPQEGRYDKSRTKTVLGWHNHLHEHQVHVELVVRDISVTLITNVSASSVANVLHSNQT